MDMFDIADKIRERRLAKGLSQQEVADGAGLTRSRLSIIENSQADDLLFSTLSNILRQLDIGLLLRASREGKRSFEDIQERDKARQASWFRSPDITDLSSRLRAARRARKMSQAVLAEIADVSRVQVNRFERGLADDIKISTLSQMLEAAGLEIAMLEMGPGGPSYEDIRQSDDEDPQP